MWSNVKKHVANMWACEQTFQCELVFALDLSLTSFHSVAAGFAILCSQHWILVNMNASTVTFIEVWGNCPCYFAMLTNTTLNRLDFEMLTRWNSFDCILVQSSNEIFMVEVKLIATEFLSLPNNRSIVQRTNILKVPQNSCGGTCSN